jgi:hypothetical protein
MDKEHMSKFEQIKQMERDIIRTIIEDAFESGCSIVIDNGEDKSERFTMNLLHNTKAECVDEVMNEINQTDEEYLIIRNQLKWNACYHARWRLLISLQRSFINENRHRLLAKANAYS